MFSITIFNRSFALASCMIETVRRRVQNELRCLNCKIQLEHKVRLVKWLSRFPPTYCWNMKNVQPYLVSLPPFTYTPAYERLAIRGSRLFANYPSSQELQK
jgi:hypothetical protein